MATTNINVTTTAQDLQSVTDVGNITSNNIELDNSAIVLKNGSLLQSGTVDNGAGGGMARVCSIGYQDEWENGIQYFIDNNSGQIIRANSINNTVPGINDDITKGYIVGSIFFDMNNQNKYICTVNTEAAAVWDSFIDEPQNLQEVTDQGAITTNAISVGDLAGLYSEISGSSIGTASVPNGTYAYMSQEGTIGMNNGDVESVLKNTNVTAGNNVVLEFPDKTSGSYTIATTADILATTNFGLFAQTGNSTTHTGTSFGTLIDGGVGSLTVPANGFSVGDSFRVEMSGLLSAQNNNTITIRLKSNAVILADSPAFTLPQVSGQVFGLSVNFTIRAIGAAGVASIVTTAQLHILKTASGTQEGFAWNVVNNTTFNTTITNLLDIQAKFSSSNANNSIYSDIFILNKIY
jgi:hypothetical protein